MDPNPNIIFRRMYWKTMIWFQPSQFGVHFWSTALWIPWSMMSFWGVNFFKNSKQMMRNMKILSISSVWKKHGASTHEQPRQLIPHGTRWPRPWWHRLDASAFRLTSVTTRQGNSAQARLGGPYGGAGGSLLGVIFLLVFFFSAGGKLKNTQSEGIHFKEVVRFCF